MCGSKHYTKAHALIWSTQAIGNSNVNQHTCKTKGMTSVHSMKFMHLMWMFSKRA